MPTPHPDRPAPRGAWLSAWCLAVAGCTGPSADPARYAADLPAPVELDDDARRRAQEAGSRALDAAFAGAIDEARIAAQHALGIDPRDARAHAALGVVAMHEAQGESPPDLPAWRRAEGELLMAHALAPADARVTLALARFHVADGHGQAALDLIDRALAGGANNDLDLLRLASVVAYEAAEERRARSYLLRVVEAAPDDAGSLYRLALCEATLAERPREDDVRRRAWQQAADRFARYVALAPEDVQGMLGEAQARFRLWQLDGASDPERLGAVRDLYRAAARLDSRSAEAVFGEGVVAEAAGDSAAAEVAYREALRREPAHAASLLNLAALLAERGATDEARACWEKALATGLTPAERRKVEELLRR